MQHRFTINAIMLINPIDLQVMVRLLTGRNPYTVMGEASQAIVFSAVAHAGIGPRLYGVGEGFRIEEYIDGHIVTYEEARNPNVLKALAQSLARLHSIDVPVQINPCWSEHTRAVIADGDKMIRASDVISNIASTMPEIAGKVAHILSLDHFKSYNSLLDEIVPRIQHRRVRLSHGDHYANNVLILNSVKNLDDITEKDVFILDIEMCSEFYRGHDVGMILKEFRYDYSNNYQPKQGEPIAAPLQRMFLEAYLSKWIELNPEKYEEKIDNYDNLLKESCALSLVAASYFPIFLMLGFIQDPKNFPVAMLDFIVERGELDGARMAEVRKMVGL